MDEKLNNPEVLLSKEKNSNKVNVVTGVDEKGNLKTVPPTKENQSKFLKFERGSNALETFLSNFIRQANKPTHTGFYRLAIDKVEKFAEAFEMLIKNPNDPQNKELMDSVKVDTSKMDWDYKPLEETQINWDAFNKIGVTKEMLEKSNSLQPLLNYGKTPILIEVTLPLDGGNVNSQARLSLKEADDGRLVPNLHTIRAEPPLDREFYGNTFTEEDKKNLLTKGNLGRLIEIKIPNQPSFNAFLSVDKLTNELVAYKADKIRIPNEIKGVALTDQHKKELAEGKGIKLEGMLSKGGKKFNATMQFNADKKQIEFIFSNTPKQSQEQKQESDKKVIRINDKILGRPIAPEEKDILKAGGTVYMEGLTDKKGELFNAYVKPNFEEGRLMFLTKNPDIMQQNITDITPDNSSQTQVAVNSEGKANEATKDVKDALKQGQEAPTEQQESQKKSRGRKM